MIEYLIDNKEWIFSGFGVTILSMIFFRRFNKKKMVQKNAKNSNPIQVSGNLSAPNKQMTRGYNSPNINATNATVEVKYGISEEVFGQWLNAFQGELGKENIINQLLEDLKCKNVTIDLMQRQIEDGMAMRKELEKRLTEKASEQAPENQPLKKFGHQEFIDNFVAFRAYYQYRKTLHLLNPSMLIELLNIYFRSVLLYPSTDLKQYYITASDGRLLRLQIDGHNDKGENILISVPELSASLLRDVCTDFVKTANYEHYQKLLVLFKRALETPDLDNAHKINILDSQNFIMKHQLHAN